MFGECMFSGEQSHTDNTHPHKEHVDPRKQLYTESTYTQRNPCSLTQTTYIYPGYSHMKSTPRPRKTVTQRDTPRSAGKHRLFPQERKAV